MKAHRFLLLEDSVLDAELKELTYPTTMKAHRFLLLEDSVLDAELTEAILLEGEISCDLIRVETQGDFQAALEQGFDLILADYALPSFDGIRALEIARSRCPEVPFIFVSATLGEELAIEALKSGATDYVLKQRLARLPSAVRRALQEAKDRQERQRIEAERDLLLEREQIARQEAEEANRIKDEFLAVLSHELRTPLNPILGWARLLRTGKHDEATRERALETIERNAKLQTQLIEDLLDISRILRGKLSLNPTSVDLALAIEAAIETVSLSATAKSIHLQTHLNPGVGQVNGDPNRLQQIIWNLLSNAIKFTPNGGQVVVRLERVEGEAAEGLGGRGAAGRGSGEGASSPEETEGLGGRGSRSLGESELASYPSAPPPLRPLAASAASAYAQLTIADTGQGINAEFLPYVFDTFRQADGSITRVFGGLGLGLAIVRHLVELHGGTVAASSPGEGQGATFTVRLPLMPVQSEVLDISPSIYPIALSEVRILVVDDDVDSRDFLCFVLEQCGARPSGAGSAAEALATLARLPFDVLISDIAMPIEDGYSLIRQIRALPPEQGSNLPAVALTAYARDEDRRQALAAGFQQYLPKPVDPDQLIAIVASLI